MCTCFGTSTNIRHSLLRGKIVRLLLADLDILLQVALAADQHLSYIFLTVFIHLINPFLHISEGFSFSEIEADYDRLSTFEELYSKAKVFFLSSCVPYVQPDLFAFPPLLCCTLFHHFDEVNAQCCHILITEAFARVHSRQLCLAYALISNQDYVNFLCLCLSLNHFYKSL